MGFFEGSGNYKILTAKLSTAGAATAQVVTGKCVFYGIIVKTDGANDVTFTVWDSLANSGTQLTPDNCVIAGTKNVESIGYPLPVECAIGIRVEIAIAGGGTAEYQVLYDDGA